MDLPVTPPIEPMLAKLVRSFPTGDLLYEPKWDGFRCIVFRDGDEVYLQSRNQRPLLRYFPELEAPLLSEMPDRVVVDGEVVVATSGALDFDALQQRIHPAESRVAMLAEQTPASFVAFDLLALDDRSLLGAPMRERRTLLEDVLSAARRPVHLTPATLDPGEGQRWFTEFEGAGLDGVIAKPLEGVYEPGKRTQFKVKHQRTADCVVGGFRLHKDGDGVGSLMLGLYAEDGYLRHVGVASSFKADLRRELVDVVAPYREDAEDGHPWIFQDGTDITPRGGNRWNAAKDTSWEALRPELVAEVAYEKLENDRFRHTARLLRFRVDKDPEDCTYDQLDVPTPEVIATVFGA